MEEKQRETDIRTFGIGRDNPCADCFRQCDNNNNEYEKTRSQEKR